MKDITLWELRDLLLGVRHAMPITLSTLTEARIPKSQAPTTFKLSRINGFIAARYRRSMERIVGEFTPKPRSWGTRIGDSPLVEHGPHFYVSIQVRRRLATVYLAKHGSLLKVVKREEVEPLLRPHNEVLEVRDFRLDHVKRLVLGCEKYRIIGA